jgi:uncharacterized protein (DUF427 family)
MTMKTPGPDHPISFDYKPMRVQLMYQGHQIADTTDVLVLREAGYRPVYYLPREDVAMDYLSKTSLSTHCPYKGEASYFTLMMDGEIAENAAWSYEDPYPAMEMIRGRIAFYPRFVEMRLHDLPGDLQPIGEVVEHTDSGAGVSQLPHWPPNVQQPRA